MLESNQPPENAEEEPGDHEAGKEGEESVAPLQVQDGREDVLAGEYLNNLPTDWDGSDLEKSYFLLIDSK